MVPISLPRLMLVTDRHATAGRDLVAVAAAAARGGVTFVQVREKDLPDGPLLALTRRLIEALPPDTLLVVNDRPAVAEAAGVGLHLPAASATPKRGTFALCGRSAHDEAEARAALAEAASYLVLGTIFPTVSKPGRRAAGPELVRRIADLVAPRPVYAIGGVNAANAATVIKAGAYGVAVRSAILEADDPGEAAATLLARLTAAGG